MDGREVHCSVCVGILVMEVVDGEDRKRDS
jgi:hypothetical protein